MAIPPDGRLTSLATLTGTLIGTEVTYIVSPGNVTSGNSFQILLSTLAAFFGLNTTAMGYTTGAGGVVTQLTSRTTTVVLNKLTGAITLFTVAPALNTPVTFTVTNSTVAATDIPIVALKSSTNTYNAFVTATAAGSFNVTVTSVVGTASDTPVLNFAIFKGAIS